jgi:DNA topoisomerase-1
MKLIIVESPTKAKTLNRFLGSSYVVDSTKGHIMDLPKSKLSIDIENNFKPDYQPIDKKKSTIAELRKKAKLADEIYIASDPDREGEAIASHVRDVLVNSKPQISNSKLKRITFHEITKKAVEEAITNPSIVNQNLVDAQISRRVLDRLVGYKLSPLLWKKVRRGLSAGRVQSVAVRLIVEKEEEIKKFKSEEYWEIWVNLKSQINTDSKFAVQLVKEKVNSKEQANKIIADLENSDYKVTSIKKKEVRKSAYPPFTTSTMTQAAARLFGFSAKRTMSIAQKLYEEGLITYHRTDSLNLSNDAVNIARSFIEKEYGKKYLPEKPIFYKTKSKSAQEAHEAIRPTDVGMPNSKLQMLNDQKKLYDLIRKRFLACQMTSAIYSETAIDVLASTNHQSLATNHYLRASGQIMIFDGWRKLFSLDKEVIILPEVKEGEMLEIDKSLPAGRQVWGDQKFTLPPARFNEASLIKTLEKLGIGRPSTYAPIISTIQLRGYVEKQEGKFLPTTVGVAVTTFLVTNFPNELDYSFTAGMEEDLDKIAEGKIKWEVEMAKFWKPFSKKLEVTEKKSERVKIETEKVGRNCPECKEGELVIRVGRFGKFISCSRFPDCRYIEKFVEKTGVKCPDCKQSLTGDAGKDGELIVKRSKRGKFFGCSNYPKCKFAAWKLPKKKEE